MSRLGQHDVGHEGVITGCDGFSLRSSIADPQGVAQSPPQSTYLLFIKYRLQLLVMSHYSTEFHFGTQMLGKNLSQAVALKP
ncbi:hypothetical protein ACIQGW_07055 [Lysinibacillus xylanilyticus]|uniref:hypothetical protein n=1 Tax=Lysinibacillus xylanilyticus TaxID=582475 RepID=UPI00382AA331